MTVLLLVLIMLTSHYKEQNDPVRQESTRLEQELESLKKKLQALTWKLLWIKLWRSMSWLPHTTPGALPAEHTLFDFSLSHYQLDKL